MTHLSREQLEHWRDLTGTPADDERRTIVEHLAICQSCAALYAELVRARPAGAATTRFDPADFVAAGLRAGGQPVQKARPRRRWLVPLAAAASFLLIVIVVRWPRATETPVTRGSAVVSAVAPSGTIDRLDAFVWDAPDGSNRFRLEVLDGSGQPVFEIRVEGRRFDVTPELRTRLRAGVEYQWMVSRLDARGETVDSSPLRRFTVAR